MHSVEMIFSGYVVSMNLFSFLFDFYSRGSFQRNLRPRICSIQGFGLHCSFYGRD